MVRIYAISLLLLIAMQLTAKWWVWGYWYTHRVELAQAYCVNPLPEITVCYGSCFLSKQLSKTEPVQNESKLPVQLLKHVEISLHVFEQSPTILYPSTASPIFPLLLGEVIPDSPLLKQLTPPPQHA